MREWYVAALMALYIISPFIFVLANKNKAVYLILCGALMIASVWLAGIKLPNNIATINEIFICRIPAFMFGVFMAACDVETIRINFKNIIRNSLRFRLLSLSGISIIWIIVFNTDIPSKMVLLRLLFLPLWLLLITIISTVAEGRKRALKALSFLGTLTFEIYLLHEKMLGIAFYFVHRLTQNTIISSLLENILAIALSIVGAFIIQKIMNHSIIRIGNDAAKDVIIQ